MTRKFGYSLAATACLGIAVPASAQDEQQRPEVFTKVLECRQLTDDAERLACFDSSVDAMASAEEANDLLLADREQVRETKRGLFGLTLPKIKLFDGGGDDDEVSEIESTVVSVSQGRSGFVFTLEDGAVWYQTDNNYLRPDPGDKITIKKAAFTSYKASLNGGPSFRIKRSR
ncbi:hypothetical protein [Pontixanthobacter luteolus]|uniref:hypothetical protein n=1 Tax=Pontixanthobacter luteolus TaxID=295089 RepID=UPI002304C75E|nr:hypothetical protein [Pontixanthobacter luteolus]